MSRNAFVPADVRDSLARVGRCLDTGDSLDGVLDRAIDSLAALPVRQIGALPKLIADAASLHRRPTSAHRHAEQLAQQPKLAFLFLFHHDGRLREAALHRIAGGLPSPLYVAAVALRLNDWAIPVREAALACARRCYPLTPPDTIAEAAMDLLLHYGSWGRWSVERDEIETAFARPDVAAHLARRLEMARTGPGSRILRAAAKRPSLDVHLERLATKAAQPSVRAAALQMIADRRVCWPDGWVWKWIDKSHGERIAVPRMRCRELTVALPRHDILHAALSDRAAHVRKAALDALIRHDLGSPRAIELAATCADDTSRLVRERAHFILARGGRDTAPRPDMA